MCSGQSQKVVYPVSVLLPNQDAYEEARKIWNATIDKRPAMIVQCASVADVVQAVNFAREAGMLLAIRGGGHNIAGNALCDDGLVIDLSGMKAIVTNCLNRKTRAFVFVKNRLEGNAPSTIEGVIDLLDNQ